MHHELLHAFELARLRASPQDDDAMTTIDERDVEWEDTNAIGFAYVGNSLGGTDRVALPRPAGFVDAYAATSAVEDRASTYAAFMFAPEKTCVLARQDTIVRAKVRVIWSRVATMTGRDDFMRARAPCIDQLIHRD